MAQQRDIRLPLGDVYFEDISFSTVDSLRILNRYTTLRTGNRIEKKHRIACRNIEQSCKSIIGTHSLETSMGRHYGRAAVRKHLIEAGDSKINIIEVRQLGTGKTCLHKDIGSILYISQANKLIYFIALLYMERFRDSF